MTDYTVRLTGQDNLTPTLNKAKSAVNDLSNSGNMLDKVRDKFDRIQKSAAPLSVKIRDVKKEMERLNVAGLQNTEMYNKLAAASKQYSQMQQQINIDAKNGVSSLGKLGGTLQSVASQAGLGQVGSMLGMIASPAGMATAAVAGTAAVLISAGKAANEFEVSLDSLGALIGKTGKELDDMGDAAIEMSKKYGIGANDIVAAMGNIGSQAPQLLKNMDAMKQVTENSIVLAQAASIPVEEASKAITTVMNQMGVSANETTNIINQLAAAEQNGSANIEYLNAAIGKSGTVANMAGMSYTELIATIEAIGPKFDSAEQAGTALQSTLLKLAASSNSDFKPGVVGMQQALENLAAAQLDEKAMTELVGQGNVKMLASLIETRGEFSNMMTAIQGTNTAFDNAAQKTDNFQGAMDRFKATWDALLIKLGQSGFMQGIMDEIESVFALLGEVFDAIEGIIDAFSELGGEGSEMINIAKIQVDLLAKAIKAVGIVVEIVVKLIVKAFNGIKDVVMAVVNWISEKWKSLVNFLGNTKWGQAIIGAWNKIKQMIYNVINTAIGWWNDFMDLLGIDRAKINISLGSTPDTTTESYQADDPNKVADLADQNVDTSDKGKKGKGKGQGSNKTKSTQQKTEKVKTKVELDEEAFDNQMKKVTTAIQRFNKGLITKEELEETAKQANQYFKDNSLKANVQIEFDENGQGFEQAAIKKIEKDTKTDLEKLRKAYDDAYSRFEQAKSDFTKGLINKEQLENEVAEINKVLKSIGVDPIQIQVDGVNKTIKTIEEIKQATENALNEMKDRVANLTSSLSGSVGQFTEQYTQFAQILKDGVANNAQIAGSSIAMLGNTLTQMGADGAIAKVGAVLAAIGQIILGFATASAQAASLGPWGWLAFVGAGLGAVAATIATIQGFADGGIIGGASYHGDKILARVNSGEMVLNQRQQANLFNLLDRGTTKGTGTTVSEVKIKGSDLYLALKNYNGKMNKIR